MISALECFLCHVQEKSVFGQNLKERIGADFHSGLFDTFGYFANMDREQGIYAGLSNKSPPLEAFHRW